MTYILTVFAIIFGTFYLSSCQPKKSSNISDEQTSSSVDTTKPLKPGQNYYYEIRTMALNMTPEQLKLQTPADQTKVFGVVMDWDATEGVATIISFETGDASMYLSNGGGIIGGGGHPRVAEAVVKFVNTGQNFLNKAVKTDTTPLPDKNCIRFYLLTNKGKFTAQEDFKNFENNTSIWTPLFTEANKVITELRMLEEKR